MKIALCVRSVPRRLAFVALALTAAAAYGQQQPSQEKETNSHDAVLLASAAPAPPSADATSAPTLPAPPPPMSSTFNWTGAYVGVNIGWGSGNADTFVNPLPTATQFINLLPQTLSPDPTGVIGGGQIGYNWQRNNFVFGAEFDFNGSGMDGTKTVSPIIQNNGTPFPGTGNHITVQQNTSWYGTLRPRVGLAFSNVLVYGTGGLAFVHSSGAADTDFRPVGTEHYPATFDETQTGWAAGGGVEVGFHSRWTVRAEYLHWDVGSTTVIANPALPLPPFQVAYTWQNTANLVRFGLNFKF